MRIGSSLARRAVAALVAVAAGGALAVAAGSAAQAKGEYKYWNSSSNLLVVTGYGSTAKAYGQWRVADSSNGTRSFLDSNTWYANADNHKKYAYFETWVNSGYCIQPNYTSCSVAYYAYASAETAHSNNGNWEWLYANTDIPANASYAKAGIIRVCLDVPFRTDPCSGGASTTGTEY